MRRALRLRSRSCRARRNFRRGRTTTRGTRTRTTCARRSWGRRSDVMLVCFTFAAKPGKEKELEALLDDPETARKVARFLGATRNTLFLAHGRMIRVLELPDGHKPPPLADLAKQDPAFAAFMAKLGPLVQDGFDAARPETLAAFNARTTFTPAYDVRVSASLRPWEAHVDLEPALHALLGDVPEEEEV